MDSDGNHTSVPGTLKKARLLLALLGMLTFLPLGLLSLDYGMRANNQDRESVRWMRQLDLSVPAFWPSGTGLRHPETRIRAVDRRHGPEWPITPADTAESGPPP